MEAWSQYAGYAVSEKPDDNGRIAVYCPELTPFNEGPVTDDTTKLILNVTDLVRGNRSIQVNVADAILCDYRAVGAAHHCAVPQVVRGELVYVERYEGSDEFFWAPTADTIQLRTADTLVILVAAKTDKTDKLDETNSYQLRIDAAAQRIAMTTTANCGEKLPLSFTMDGKQGSITLQAGPAMLEINGSTDSIKLTTSNGTGGLTISGTTVKVLGAMLTLLDVVTVTATMLVMKPLSFFQSRVRFEAGTSGCTSH